MRATLLILPAMLLACQSNQQERNELPHAKDSTAVAAANIPIDEELYYETGELKMKGQTLNGQKHGLWTAYFENGGVQSRNEFQNGVLHGSSVVFHKNGMTYYSGSYTNGEKSGTWRFFYENGTEAKVEEYGLP